VSQGRARSAKSQPGIPRADQPAGVVDGGESLEGARGHDRKTYSTRTVGETSVIRRAPRWKVT
jgi:hypothetical protein